MRALVKTHRYFVRKMKDVVAESWIQQPQDAVKPFQKRDLEHLNIKYFRDVKKDLDVNIKEEQMRPVCAKMGPIKVCNPKTHDKMYRWCSCGLSNKQPFCDGHHDGTKFKPLKFTIEQKVNEINLCGCKMSSEKPFCDNIACKKDQS